ncbi:hypothetical protein J2Y40_000544 [Chryseobacterium sp. 2987]|nr:hypothetical protein [Chryseobacterium sp. 2987]
MRWTEVVNRGLKYTARDGSVKTSEGSGYKVIFSSVIII